MRFFGSKPFLPYIELKLPKVIQTSTIEVANDCSNEEESDVLGIFCDVSTDDVVIVDVPVSDSQGTTRMYFIHSEISG